MDIVVSGLPKARECAAARVDQHFNLIATQNAHRDALDLRLRLKGETQGDDPVLAREAARQALIERINAAGSIDDLAALIKDWDQNGIR